MALSLQLIDTFWGGFLNNFLKSFLFFSLSFRCNFMPRGGCSAFYGLNPSKKVKSHGNKRKV